ncbi:hypothetical protein ZOSMA_7G01400 [Zostera marina]|uniref:Hydroxyproline O-arabinosyltransferase-like domain-containing protein n=1 Tax=Zostera marina TaxID=29655 RepID=A0A0K9NMX6_ZOSMR|nr:hypothetical protein ZOSMA_7G01400 [Zostera marina]
MNSGPVTLIDPIGNSPAIIKKSVLKKIAPTWMDVSIKMKNDPETVKIFGWILEMYGYAIASALHGVRHILHPDFMVQPPFDPILEGSFIIHYTYGNDYNTKGELTYGVTGDWSFNKRSYKQSSVPRNIILPPSGVPETVVQLVQMINEATANIPNWDSLDDGN